MMGDLRILELRDFSLEEQVKGILVFSFHLFSFFFLYIFIILFIKTILGDFMPVVFWKKKENFDEKFLMLSSMTHSGFSIIS